MILFLLFSVFSDQQCQTLEHTSVLHKDLKFKVYTISFLEIRTEIFTDDMVSGICF